MLNALPNVLMPFDGECYISWLIRLAQANCFDDVKTFLNRYVKHDIGHELRCIDDRLPVKDIFSRLGLDMPLIEFYRAFAMIPKIAPFIHDLVINSVYLKSFYEPYGYEIPFKASTISSLMIRPKICPECWKERQVIWQEHNYDPEIKVCARHGIPLMTMQMEKGIYGHKNLFDISNYRVLKVEDLEAERLLAAYIKRFAEKNYSLTRKEMYHFIYRNIDSNSLLLSSRKIRDGFGLYEGCRKIMAKYPDPDVLDDLLQPYLINIDEAKIRQMGFEVISSISCNCINAKHKKCGEEFITSYGAITDGYGCPCCDRDKRKFKKVSGLIRHKSKDNFKLKSLLPKGEIEIIHTCGTIKKIRLADYLGYAPECTGCDKGRKKMDLAKTRNIVFQKSEGKLEFAGHIRHSRKKYKCVICGRTFDLNDNSINAEQYCRLCREEEKMKEKVDKQLEKKPDLKVIRYPTVEDKTVSIMCMNCGETFEHPFRNSHGIHSDGKGNVTRVNKYNCPICGNRHDKKTGRLYRLIRKKFIYKPFTIAEINNISDEKYLDPQFKLLMKKGLIKKIGTVEKKRNIFALPDVEIELADKKKENL